MKQIILLIALAISNLLLAQPNCQAFKYYGDTLKCLACEKSEEANKYYQFTKKFQEILDESLAIDSTYAYAYREKSVAYLKSGDFLTWKKLIDKAVEYNPKENLGYRGWCRYQFFRDYRGAIQDIELLDSMVEYGVGTGANGDYDLHIARALCYKALGDKQKAIQVIEDQLNEEGYFLGLYDYLHLGVLYLEVGNYEKAFDSFFEQQKENNLAENQYYLALAFKEAGKQSEYFASLKEAQRLYLSRKIMIDAYTHHSDKVFLSDIVAELELAKQGKEQ